MLIFQHIATFSSRLGSLFFYRMQSFLVLTLRTGLRKKLYTNVWFLFTKKAIGSSQNSSAVQTGLIHVIGLDFRFARWYDRFQFLVKMHMAAPTPKSM